MPAPNLQTSSGLARAVSEELRVSPRALVITQLEAILEQLKALRAGEDWRGVTLWEAGERPGAPSIRTNKDRCEERMARFESDPEMLRQSLAPADPGELLVAINNLLVGYQHATGAAIDEVRSIAAEAVASWPWTSGEA